MRTETHYNVYRVRVRDLYKSSETTYESNTHVCDNNERNVIFFIILDVIYSFIKEVTLSSILLNKRLVISQTA